MQSATQEEPVGTRNRQGSGPILVRTFDIAWFVSPRTALCNATVAVEPGFPISAVRLTSQQNNNRAAP